MNNSSSWEQQAKQKKAEVDKHIPKEWILPVEVTSQYNEKTPISVLDLPQKFLNSNEFDITENYSVSQLLDELKSGRFSAVDVVCAFSHRAAIATQVTNCCTEIMFDYGRERAQFLDDYLAKYKVPYGPLHGLPISLKDSFNIPGFDSTLGFVSFIGNKSAIKDVSSYVKLLTDLGAVFYVKTNIPQTLMTADSENNIFGRTLNPNNLTWTAGGSTGGEGALIKMRGSLLGIGTDVAGSIRIPALCNGVYGFRPTSHRTPMCNQTDSSREVFVDILAVAGPLAYDFETIELLMKNTIDSQPWKYDSSCLRLKYQSHDVTKESKLKIGIIYEDPSLPTHPPLKRIIGEVSTLLEKEGHQIEVIKSFPSYDEMWSLAWSLFKTDENSTSWDHLTSTGERIINSLLLPGMDDFGDGPKDINDLIMLKTKVNDITNQWLEIFENIDVLITPGSPSTAPPHDDYGIAPYTCAWNLLDFPAAIIPYGTSDEKVDIDDNIEYPAKLKGVYAHYDSKLYNGGVGHIQVIAPHLEDEKLLSCCSIIDNILHSK